jgi:hypothetical protein
MLLQLYVVLSLYLFPPDFYEVFAVVRSSFSWDSSYDPFGLPLYGESTVCTVAFYTLQNLPFRHLTWEGLISSVETSFE